MRSRKTPVVHMVSHMTFAAIWTLCGAGMQDGGEDGWTKDVNCWGATGVVKTKGWEVATINPEHVTCPACRARLKNKRRGRREGEQRAKG